MSIAFHQRVADSPARATPTVLRLASLPLSECRPCHLRQGCPPCASPIPCSPGVDRPALGRRRVLKGDVLCREGEDFESLFAVCSGSMKAVMGLPDGREQVINFLLAGDLVALDAIANGRHTRTVTAIEDTQVCPISYSFIASTMDTQHSPKRTLSRQLSLEIVRTHRMMLLLGSMNAQERLAAFLLDLSHRLRCGGLPARDLTLRMSRAEVGSFLGLTLETVSRTLSLFQLQGLLTVNNRRIRLHDPESFAGRFEAVLQG